MVLHFTGYPDEITIGAMDEYKWDVLSLDAVK